MRESWDHRVDVDLAMTVGPQGAILLRRLLFIELSAERTGRKPPHQTYDRLATQFPWWSPSQIRYRLTALEEAGFLTSQQRVRGGKTYQIDHAALAGALHRQRGITWPAFLARNYPALTDAPRPSTRGRTWEIRLDGTLAEALGFDAALLARRLLWCVLLTQTLRGANPRFTYDQIAMACPWWNWDQVGRYIRTLEYRGVLRTSRTERGKFYDLDRRGLDALVAQYDLTGTECLARNYPVLVVSPSPGGPYTNGTPGCYDDPPEKPQPVPEESPNQDPQSSTDRYAISTVGICNFVSCSTDTQTEEIHSYATEQWVVSLVPVWSGLPEGHLVQQLSLPARAREAAVPESEAP